MRRCPATAQPERLRTATCVAPENVAQLGSAGGLTPIIASDSDARPLDNVSAPLDVPSRSDEFREHLLCFQGPNQCRRLVKQCDHSCFTTAVCDSHFLSAWYWQFGVGHTLYYDPLPLICSCNLPNTFTQAELLPVEDRHPRNTAEGFFRLRLAEY